MPELKRRQASVAPHMNARLTRFREEKVDKLSQYTAWRSMTYSQIIDMLLGHALDDLMPECDDD
jgi:hypothetical protein